MMSALKKNETLPSIPWSIRATELFHNTPRTELEQNLRSVSSRLSPEGFKYACENAGPLTLLVNDAFLHDETAECNEEFCEPIHNIRLNACDETTKQCTITTWGATKTYPCDLVANYTIAAIHAKIPKDDANPKGRPLLRGATLPKDGKK